MKRTLLYVLRKKESEKIELSYRKKVKNKKKTKKTEREKTTLDST